MPLFSPSRYPTVIDLYFSDFTPIQWLQCRIALLFALVSPVPLYSQPQYYSSDMLISCIDLNTAQRDYGIALHHTAYRLALLNDLIENQHSVIFNRSGKLLEIVMLTTIIDIEKETLNSLQEQKKANDLLPKPDDGSNRAFENIQAGQTEERELAMAHSVWNAINAAYGTGITDAKALHTIAREAAIASKNQAETNNANLRAVEIEIRDDAPSAADPDLSRLAERIEMALKSTESKIDRLTNHAQAVNSKIDALNRQLELFPERHRRYDEAVREAEAAEISAKEELDKIQDAYNKYILQNPQATEVPLDFYNRSDQDAAQEDEYTSGQDIIDTRQHFSEAQESVDSYDTHASQVVGTYPNVMTDNL